MNILYDTQLKIDADLDHVWEALTSPELRNVWQAGLSDAQLIAGEQGYRGAQTELRLTDIGQTVVERVRRSCPQERLQRQFRVDASSYEQIFYLSRLDDDQTLLTYHCKHVVLSGWRKVFGVKPSTPKCLVPETYHALNRLFEQQLHETRHVS